MFGIDQLGSIFGTVGKVIDDLHTSEEEKLTLKNRFVQLQGNVTLGVLEFQGALNAAKASIITAEAKSSSWLTANWRPLTMITFVFLIVARWLGFTAENLTPELELELFKIIKIGIGGYIGGRSLEKIVKVGAAAVKDYKK